MNREDIIRMGLEAGMRLYCDSWTIEDDPDSKNPKQISTSHLERFANLVCQLERERIAKKIEQLPFGDTSASFAIFVREDAQKN